MLNGRQYNSTDLKLCFELFKYCAIADLHYNFLIVATPIFSTFRVLLFIITTGCAFGQELNLFELSTAIVKINRNA